MAVGEPPAVPAIRRGCVPAGGPGGAAPHFRPNDNVLINQASLFYAGRLFGPYAGKWFGAAPDSALNQFGIFSLAYAAAAAAAKPQNYRPAALNGEVLAAIALVGAHESGEVVFDAPVKPGRYPYLCSFPGHCQIGMRGELIGQ